MTGVYMGLTESARRRRLVLPPCVPQVLHLAEVLHNTPKHPLCVKALQRRAVAFQVRQMLCAGRYVTCCCSILAA